ncbi:mitotic fidelity of chromosome transmission-related protein [Exophiala xenobiotica]|nr:mitotic fidelity of chromosome transmission-related protein [Exophiala xenobiotica]
MDDAPKEDTYAEPWETGSGTLRGSVSIWDPIEQAPLVEEEEIEIAHAPAAIKTREVKGSSLHEGPTFRYAKFLSTKYFGTGLVDLPPGGIKRPKNSRKMHMSFFVVKGRVTVSVGPMGADETGSMNRFSIGKGGYWQVPRGNQYSIENELDKPARIFFSQGCETSSAADEE